MMATTPIGTRILATLMPEGRLRGLVTSPMGSGSAAICRRPSAIAAITLDVSVRRSTAAESRFCRFASSRSRALASISCLRPRSIAAAISFNARFLVAVLARATMRAAARAWRPTLCM
ncbi:hypothetical protein D3C83_00960 [compost metagenome]